MRSLTENEGKGETTEERKGSNKFLSKKEEEKRMPREQREREAQKEQRQTKRTFTIKEKRGRRMEGRNIKRSQNILGNQRVWW